MVSRLWRALAIAALGTCVACGGSQSTPTAPSPGGNAVLAIETLTARVQPLTTTPQPGLLYILTYQVRETAGRTGATLVSQYFAFANGASAEGLFNSSPHVAPSGTLPLTSTYSVYPATTPTSRVTFSIAYTDDAGKAGTVSAQTDISQVGF